MMKTLLPAPLLSVALFLLWLLLNRSFSSGQILLGALLGLLLPLLLAAQPVATVGYLPALPEIARDLGSASSSLTVFMLAFGVAQLVCGPLA
ncbi:hypothetical protein ABXL43_35440, partial [Burkholderia sola]